MAAKKKVKTKQPKRLGIAVNEAAMSAVKAAQKRLVAKLGKRVSQSETVRIAAKLVK